MRTLLVDNYDSYTYNLHRLITQVFGAAPIVVYNDDPVLRAIDASKVDNVVISPGPGHPGNPRNLGLAADLLTRTRVPTLGVCLGHQGIAFAANARVVPAPAARHGHLSQIDHRDKDLFRGLPQRFTAVRYHSLCVPEPLPAELEALAWSEDRVLMGLRHRERPLWGVQFHPESVETECGAELLANFALLTGESVTLPARRRTEPRMRDSGPRPAPGPYLLVTRVLDTEVDTAQVFNHLYADSVNAFWLDSARTEPGLSRFSFLGDAAGPLAEIVRYRAGTGTVEITNASGITRREHTDIFAYLGHELRNRCIAAPSLPFDFTCGYVGYFGYELRAELGSPCRHRSSDDDATWIFADRMVAVDHAEGKTYLLGLTGRDGAGSGETETWLDRTARSLARLSTRPSAVPVRVAPSPALLTGVGKSRDQYMRDVAACRRELLAGESYEICLTNMLHVSAGTRGFDAYLRLRHSNPAPYAAFLRVGDTEVVCSSPERFLRVTPDGIVETKPMKGTCRRGRTATEDARLRADLAADPKTRAENLMIVDLLRNDLGRVCETDSVHVPHLMHVETYATVHQLVSTIRGRLKPGIGVMDCVRACFPGGSMTGAPKLRTMEIIDGLENEARGIYSGSIGYLGLGGGADLNIVIRTAVGLHGHWRVGAGGAIVLDSDPYEEYEEMRLKAAAPIAALQRLDEADHAS